MKKLLIILILICVGSASAEITYEWDGSEHMGWVNGGWLNFGNVFEADIDQEVTALGAYFAHAVPQWTLPDTSGQDNNVDIKLYEFTSLTDLGGNIWDPVGSVIAQVSMHYIDNPSDFTVTTGEAKAHFMNLETPVSLTAGTKYMVGMTTTLDPQMYISLMGSANMNVHGITHIHAAEGYFQSVINQGSTYYMRGSWIGGPTMIYMTGAPVGTIEPYSISLTEDSSGTPSDTYTITLSEQPPAGASFRVYLDPDDLKANSLDQVAVSPANAGTDANTALDIVFDSANWSPVTVTVTAVDDGTGEGPVDLTLNHSLVLVSGGPLDPCDPHEPNWAGARLMNSLVTVAVTDDDARYAVTVDELGGLNVSETGPTSDDFTVALEKQPTITVTVDIASDAQTSLSSNALVFNSGNWNTPQTVTVTAVDDTVGEADPQTSDISYSVYVGTINWNSLSSDNFNNTLKDGWTTYMNELTPDPGDPCDITSDANAVHDGSQLLVYGSTMAIAPGDYMAPYRVTVECDLTMNSSGERFNVIYLRNDGASHYYNNGDVIRCGWWDGNGGSLLLDIAGNDHSKTGVPMPGMGVDPSLYRFIIEDFGDMITLRMENVTNPSNFLETSGSGSYTALGAGSKVALGLIEEDNILQDEYIAFDNFAVDQLAAGQDEKIAWLGALIEVAGDLDGNADVDDNDCLIGRDAVVDDSDYDDDCDIDLADFAVFAGQFLDCLKPNGGTCY